MQPYAAPHRAPDELLQSRLPDAHVRIWQGMRSVQGGKPGSDVPPASYPLSYIGQRCAKSENAVSKALVQLKRFGWIEEVGRDGKHLVFRCHIGQDYSRTGDEYASGIPPDGKDDSASREDNGDASRLTGRIVLPDGKDDSASREDSPTPPNKDSSYQNPILNLETTTTVEPDGESAPATTDGGVVVVSEDGDSEVADPERDAKNRAWALLRDRGVARAVELAKLHWRDVPAAVAVYDAKLAAGEIAGPGWFAGALPNWTEQRPTPARQAAKHAGRLPEAQRAAEAIHAPRVPPASAETVSSAVAEIAADVEAGRRLLAERRAAAAEKRSAARRPPPIPAVAGPTEVQP